MTRNAAQIPSTLHAYIKAVRRAVVHQFVRGRNAYPTCESEQKRTAPAANNTADPASETGHAGALVINIAPRVKLSKVPLSTYITADTQQRVEWLKKRCGYAITDVAEKAFQDFLDEVDAAAQDTSAGLITRGLSAGLVEVLPGPRKKSRKVSFTTHITGDTQQRIEMLKNRGYAVTDVVEEALRRFLDDVGVPDADAIGEQWAPGFSPENQPLVGAATP